MKRRLSLIIICLLVLNCKKVNNFGQDVEYLKKYTDVVVLEDGDRRLAVVPAYQGRVMTSTNQGTAGPSFGFLHYEVIKTGVEPPAKRKGKLSAHMHAFGGEERFWLGPEGGQYGIFFKPKAKFDFAEWLTPAAIDTDAYKLIKQTKTKAQFQHSAQLTNHSGTQFNIAINRTIELVTTSDATKLIDQNIPDSIRYVGYSSDNEIKNQGDTKWQKATGLLSIWILGMYKPSPKTIVVIPIAPGSEEEMGVKVNDTYFGKVPDDHLRVKGNTVFFKGDGTRRGKIGINPKRSKGIAGSYDALTRKLTLVAFQQPKKFLGYVNSEWVEQKEPYGGDAINSYNDGAAEPGQKPLGPFYELETSSPAAELAPGGTLKHKQYTLHLQGPERDLDVISKKTLGVSLAEITAAFE